MKNKPASARWSDTTEARAARKVKERQAKAEVESFGPARLARRRAAPLSREECIETQLALDPPTSRSETPARTAISYSAGVDLATP